MSQLPLASTNTFCADHFQEIYLFSCNENEDFLRQTCWPFQYAHFCKIWDHLAKLSFETSHNIGHLAGKPWIFILDSSFWEDFFKIFALFQVCYFIWLLGHKWWCNVKVLHFFDLFWIVYTGFKMRSKRGAWPVIAIFSLWNFVILKIVETANRKFFWM